MVFNTPLIPFQQELYSMLGDREEMSFALFDSGLSLEEILPQLKGMEEINFGTIADISCNQTSAKVDAIIWKVSARIELFSTYKGRKKVAKMINEIGNIVTTKENVFNTRIKSKGFDLVRLEIGESVIGTALTEGGLTWQNGSITLNYWLCQN